MHASHYDDPHMDERPNIRPRLFQIAAAVFLILVSGSVGYALGIENPRTIVIKGVTGAENGGVPSSDFGIFWDTWEGIQRSYLKAGEVKTQTLIYGSAKGLVESLDDPYSMFMTPADSKRFAEDLNGKFGGIGAEIGIKNDQLIVVAPLKDSPAEKAGLIAGDKILEINASSTAGVAINDAVTMIRGIQGTTVILTIGRKDREKPIKVPIVRDIIRVPVLEWEMKEGSITHIKFFTFSEDAAERMRKAVLEAKAAGMRGIVLDMRNNPGGYLDAAVEIAGYFVPAGNIVVFEEFRNGKRDEFRAQNTPLAQEIPIVILLNDGSASASEILAGALKDIRGVKIVGEKSFGKGTVQELTELKDGSELKLTIAHWILPKGAQIDKNGIEPDIEVKMTDDDREKKRDPQLIKALEVLKAQIK